MPDFLQEYEWELDKTVLYLIDLEKIPIFKDEIKAGFNYLKREIDAEFIKDKVDVDATKRAIADRKKRLASDKMFCIEFSADHSMFW